MARCLQFVRRCVYRSFRLRVSHQTPKVMKMLHSPTSYHPASCPPGIPSFPRSSDDRISQLSCSSSFRRPPFQRDDHHTARKDLTSRQNHLEKIYLHLQEPRHSPLRGFTYRFNYHMTNGFQCSGRGGAGCGAGSARQHTQNPGYQSALKASMSTINDTAKMTTS